MEIKATLNIGKNAEIKYDSVTVKAMYDSLCGTLDNPVCINTVEEAMTFDYFD